MEVRCNRQDIIQLPIDSQKEPEDGDAGSSAGEPEMYTNGDQEAWGIEAKPETHQNTQESTR